MNDALVRQIENRLEAIPLRMPLIQEPLKYNIWNLLNALEHKFNTYVTVGEAMNPSLLAVIDRLKYGLKYSLNWIHNASKDVGQFNLPITIHQGRFAKASKLLEMGMEYDGIVAAYIYYSRGIAKAQIINESKIKFVSNENELRYDVLDHIISNNRGKESVELAGSTLSQELHENGLMDKMLKSIEYRHGDHIRVNLNNDDILAINESSTLSMKPQFVFPDSWSFNGLSIALLRQLWSLSTTFMALHMICHYHVLAKGHYQNGLASLVLLMGYKEWVKRLSDLIGPEHIKEIGQICKMLTYDCSCRKPDPALQPIFDIGGDYIVIPPQLYIGSRHERNLMAFLARNHKDDYDKTTGLLEDAMLDELYDLLSVQDFEISIKKKIMGVSDLPDIDMAVYQTLKGCLLLVETKWVIAPSETFEKLERAEREKKGIEQVRQLLSFAKEEPRKVWESCYPDKKMPNDLKIFGCVAMRGFVGTYFNQDLEIPVIEDSLLVEKLMTVNNLPNVISWLNNREFLPVNGRDFRSQEIPCEIGPYTIIWNGYELIK